MYLTARQLVSVLLFIFILTAASVPLSGQQPSKYDPWLDYNEDGQINASDLSSLAQAYGAEGEPIKNVTIVGHSTKLVRAAVNFVLSPQTTWDSGLIWIDGYAKVTILISLAPSDSNRLQIFAHDYTGLAGTAWLVDRFDNIGAYTIKTYDVINQQIRISVYDGSPTQSCTLNVDVYLMA